MGTIVNIIANFSRLKHLKEERDKLLQKKHELEQTLLKRSTLDDSTWSSVSAGDRRVSDSTHSELHDDSVFGDSVTSEEGHRQPAKLQHSPIKRSSSYTETHFGAEDSDVFTSDTADSKRSSAQSQQSDTAASWSQEGHTADKEDSDSLMDSGSDFHIPKITRERGLSKESFESEFDLSFSDSGSGFAKERTMPPSDMVQKTNKIETIVDSGANTTNSSSSEKNLQNETSKSSDADEWGQLEVEFKLNRSRDSTNDIAKETGSKINDQKVEKPAKDNVTHINSHPESTRSKASHDHYEKTDGVKEQQQDRKHKYMVSSDVLLRSEDTTDFSTAKAESSTEKSSNILRKKERNESLDMLAEIDAEIERRTRQSVTEDNRPLSVAGSEGIGEYIVGKDKASISDNTGGDSQETAQKDQQRYDSYVVGKDRESVPSEHTSHPPPSTDRSNAYVTDKIQTQGAGMTSQQQNRSSSGDADTAETYDSNKGKKQFIDGTPIVSKYKQRKKDRDVNKEKYVRKESKDIYIVERTEENETDPFLVDTDGQAKYADKVKVSDSSHKDSSTVPYSSQQGHKQSVSSNSARVSSNSQSKNIRKYTDTDSKPEAAMPSRPPRSSNSASRINTSQKPLSGSGAVEIVDTKSLTGIGGGMSKDDIKKAGKLPPSDVDSRKVKKTTGRNG